MSGNVRHSDPLLIVALAGGASVTRAAAAAGVNERTVYRRLEDPEFKKKVQAARAELISRATGELAEGATEAAKVLRILLRYRDSPYVMLGAARVMLAAVLKLRESDELEQRLAALEERLDKEKRL